MKRKLNYTGRKRIKRERISITLNRKGSSIISFSLNRLDIDDMNLPPESKIYVEAYYRTELKRFEFGSVADRTSPSSPSLGELAYPENLKFRILIVKPESSAVLAHATGIIPKDSVDKNSILPVEFKDLDVEIWRVEYEGDGGRPILFINNKIPNIQNIARQNSLFFVHVYPVVIREIMFHMVFVDKIDSTNDPSVEWHKEWLGFSRGLGVTIPETLNLDDDNFDKDDAIKWIEEVVSAFSNRYVDRFHKYQDEMEAI